MSVNESARPDEGDTMSPSQTMNETTRAVTAAHDGHRDRALAGVRWERRGVLGRLVRSEAALAPPQALPEPARRAA
jgi:hypothetical protein